MENSAETAVQMVLLLGKSGAKLPKSPDCASLSLFV
jgi:hypothetical protein